MSTTVLHSTAQVRAAIRSLFTRTTRGRRRVILSAYVGAEAPTLLPDLRGTELYCWPQPGGTNPNALRGLQRLNVKIHFADRLHMKVYWVESTGCVITSANLSSNALGVNGLMEAGVLFSDPTAVPIDRIIGATPHRPMTVAALERLQRSHDLFWSRQRPEGRIAVSPVLTFKEWLEGAPTAEWKLSWWSEEGDEAKSTAAAARATFGRPVQEFIDCVKGDFAEGDWVLLYRRHLPSERVGALSWLLVQLVNPLLRHEVEDGFTHQAVQVSPLNRAQRPPFKIDRAFAAAFRRAARQFGPIRLAQGPSVLPPRRFLRYLCAAVA